MIVIQHSVEDFAAWKKAFDSDPAGRAEHGVTRHAIYRSADAPDDVVINLEFASRDQAQEFLELPALREAWRNFGVEDLKARILDEVEIVDY
jgi:quinol monooxygenase YgiN